MIAMKLLDAVLILMPLGEIIFDSFLRGEVAPSSIVCLCVGFLYMVLPVNRIVDFINEENFNLE